MLQRFLEKARAPRLCGLEIAGFLGKMAIDSVAAIDSCAVAVIDLGAVAAICVIEKIVAVAAILSYANYMPLESTTSNCTMLDQFSAFCTIFWSKLVQKAEGFSGVCTRFRSKLVQKAERQVGASA